MRLKDSSKDRYKEKMSTCVICKAEVPAKEMEQCVDCRKKGCPDCVEDHECG